jgi:5'-deoxynucleotidase YfbR-like HD superfamily hydrolase
LCELVDQETGEESEVSTAHVFDEILAIRASGYVRRWHTIYTHREQSDAEHSAQALSLLLLLHPHPSPHIVKAMLWHDMAERVVGDAPAQVKRAFPLFGKMYEEIEAAVMLTEMPSAHRAISTLSDDDKHWLKAIDTLELWLFAREEMKLGNIEFGVTWERAYRYLTGNENTPKRVIDFVTWYLTDGDKRSFA